MSVKSFFEHLLHLNNIIKYFPDPDPNQPDEMTPKLTNP